MNPIPYTHVICCRVFPSTIDKRTHWNRTGHGLAIALHDTHYVVAHSHYVLTMGALLHLQDFTSGWVKSLVEHTLKL